MKDENIIKMSEFIRKYEMLRKDVKEMFDQIETKRFEAFSKKEIHAFLVPTLQKRIDKREYEEDVCQCLIDNFDYVYDEYLQNQNKLKSVKQELESEKKITRLTNQVNQTQELQIPLFMQNQTCNNNKKRTGEVR